MIDHDAAGGDDALAGEGGAGEGLGRSGVDENGDAVPDIDLKEQGIDVDRGTEEHDETLSSKMKTMFQFSRSVTNSQAHFFRSIKGQVVDIVLMQQISFVEVDAIKKTVTLSKNVDAKGVFLLPLHFKRILLTILTCPPHILTF